MKVWVLGDAGQCFWATPSKKFASPTMLPVAVKPTKRPRKWGSPRQSWNPYWLQLRRCDATAVKSLAQQCFWATLSKKFASPTMLTVAKCTIVSPHHFGLIPVKISCHRWQSSKIECKTENSWLEEWSQVHDRQSSTFWSNPGNVYRVQVCSLHWPPVAGISGQACPWWHAHRWGLGAWQDHQTRWSQLKKVVIAMPTMRNFEPLIGKHRRRSQWVDFWTTSMSKMFVSVTLKKIVITVQASKCPSAAKVIF